MIHLPSGAAGGLFYFGKTASPIGMKYQITVGRNGLDQLYLG
ncbi:hypothetical protein MY9_1410 [Bacillus sp. JS]|nr:hypothetical protein MY9_1410 [Bacillus sp. JS]